MQNGLKKNVYCRQKEANAYSLRGLHHFYCCLFTVSLSVTVFKLTNPPIRQNLSHRYANSGG